MQISKLFAFISLLLIYALGCAASYAQENRSPIFLAGKVGSNVGLVNCSANCSANTSGAIGLGFSGDIIESPDHSTPINMWNSISLEYKRDQFSFNGNQLNVETKGIELTMGYMLQDASRYVLALGVGGGWQTTSGTNMSEHTTFNPYGNISLLYKVNSGLYLTLGYSHDFIYSGYPDFISNSVNVGFRWYPSVSK